MVYLVVTCMYLLSWVIASEDQKYTCLFSFFIIFSAVWKDVTEIEQEQAHAAMEENIVKWVCYYFLFWLSAEVQHVVSLVYAREMM